MLTNERKIEAQNNFKREMQAEQGIDFPGVIWTWGWQVQCKKVRLEVIELYQLVLTIHHFPPLVKAALRLHAGIKLGSHLQRNLTNRPGKTNADLGGKQIHINNRRATTPAIQKNPLRPSCLTMKGQPGITTQRKNYSSKNGKGLDKHTKKGILKET